MEPVAVNRHCLWGSCTIISCRRRNGKGNSHHHSIGRNSENSGPALPELKNFLNLINGDKPADEFCKEVEKEIWKTKQDAETRRNFMDFEYMKMLAQIDAKKEERISIFASLVRDGVLSLIRQVNDTPGNKFSGPSLPINGPYGSLQEFMRSCT